jgi:hypothetical protein
MAALVLMPLLLAGQPALATGGARVTCEITENGQAASGTMAVVSGDAEIADGVCGKPLAIPPGTHEVVLRLDGALDGPELRRSLDAASGKTTPLTGDFATGLLEVRIQSDGKDTAGIAVIRKGGRQIGTLGSGVTAHLSVGSYEVIARYRTHQRRFDTVRIERDQRTALSVGF